MWEKLYQKLAEEWKAICRSRERRKLLAVTFVYKNIGVVRVIKDWDKTRQKIKGWNVQGFPILSALRFLLEAKTVEKGQKMWDAVELRLPIGWKLSLAIPVKT
jgi:hypothetical protein